MVQKSSFLSDLDKEQQLTKLLDNYYTTHLEHYTFERVTDKKEQYRGIDVKFIHKKTGAIYLIDEKAQLDYINENLPTFAFEISYNKNGVVKPGWFFDDSKNTHFYALITGIYSNVPEGFLFCNITLVNRQKLITFLQQKNITKQCLLDHFEFCGSKHGKIALDQLDEKKEGYLYYSRTNKAEKPLNLILKLDWLLEQKIAKRLV